VLASRKMKTTLINRNKKYLRIFVQAIILMYKTRDSLLQERIFDPTSSAIALTIGEG